MSFLQKFDGFVCLGDSITCEVGAYTVTARIAHDDTPDRPDQRQDGFWPSLYKDDAGFIGAGNGFRDRFDKAQAKAQAIMDTWKNDEWFYCGKQSSAVAYKIEHIRKDLIGLRPSTDTACVACRGRTRYSPSWA